MTLSFDLFGAGTTSTPRVSDFPELEAGLFKFVKQGGKKGIGNPVVTEAKNISITFDYPLLKPATFPFTSESGFTLKDLFRCVYEGYTKIYAAETDPGFVPGTLNRGTSEGPYGIWGHGIQDLYLEAFTKEENGTAFSLVIGS